MMHGDFAIQLAEHMKTNSNGGQSAANRSEGRARKRSFAVIQQGMKNFSLMKSKLKEMDTSSQSGLNTEMSKRHSMAIQKQSQDNVTNEILVLQSVLLVSTRGGRLEKALRHLNDAIYIRKVRHDLDVPFTPTTQKLAFYLQQSAVWNEFMILCSCLYLGLGFFEPAHSNQQEYSDTSSASKITALKALEGTVLFLFWFDIFLSRYHKLNAKKKSKLKMMFAKRYILQYLLYSLFTVDAILFWTTYPRITIRFGRYFRPGICIVSLAEHLIRYLKQASFLQYDKQLRRSLSGVFRSLKNIFDLFAFFLLVSLVFALVAWRLIGTVDEIQTEDGYDHLTTGFDSYSMAVHIMFVLLSGEGYPEAIIPAVEYSQFYLMLFLPYISCSLLVLLPIPIAVLFNEFRIQRSKTILTDEIREREALFACFVTLDFENNLVVTKEAFKSLFIKKYGNSKDIQEQIDLLFELSVTEKRNHIVTEFMMTLPEFKGHKRFNIFFWTTFKISTLRKLTDHWSYASALLVLTVMNLALLIFSWNYQQPDGDEPAQIADLVLFSLFMFAIVLECLARGLQGYFRDLWNILDFIITLISVSTVKQLVVVRIIFKLGKVIKIRASVPDNNNNNINTQTRRKSQLTFKERFSNKIRKSGIAFELKSFLKRSKNFLIKIFIVFPTVFRLTILIFVLLYFYANLAAEIFNSTRESSAESEFITHRYYSYDTLGGSMLAFSQLIYEQVWLNVLNDILVRFDYPAALVIIFFDSFFFITNFVFLALIEGIVWEVFVVVDKSFEERQKLKGLLQKLTINTMSKDLAVELQIPKEVIEEEDEEQFEDLNEEKDDKENDLSMEFRRRSTSLVEGTSKFQTRPTRKRNATMTSKKTIRGSLSGNTGISGAETKSKDREEENHNVRLDCLADDSFLDDVALQTQEAAIGKEPKELKQIMASNFIRSSNKESVLDSPNASALLDNSALALMKDLPKNRQSTTRRKSEEIPGELRINLQAYLQMIKADMPDEQPKDLELNEGGSSNSESDTVTAKDESKPGSGKIDEHLENDQSTEKPKGDLIEDHERPLGRRSLDSPTHQRALSIVQQDEEPEGTARKERNISITGKSDPNLRRKAFLNNDNSQKQIALLAQAKVSKVRRRSLQNEIRNQRRGGIALVGGLDSGIDEDEKLKRLRMVSQNAHADSNTHHVYKKLKAFRNSEAEKINTVTEISEEGKYYQKKFVQFETAFSDILKRIMGISSDQENPDALAPVVSKYRKVGCLNLNTRKRESSKPYLQQKRDLLIKSNMSQEILLRKAFLHNANLEAVKEYEEEHLKHLYGEYYDGFKMQKESIMSELYDIENRVTVQLMRIMRESARIPVESFAATLFSIEESITYQLMPEGSLAKFLFKGGNDRWFMMTKSPSTGQIEHRHLLNGPWNYFEKVFPENGQIYFAKDAFFPGKRGKYKMFVERLIKSIQKIEDSFHEKRFSKFDQQCSEWNMFAIPFAAEKGSNKAIVQLFKKYAATEKVNLSNLYSYGIKKCLFISLFMLSAKRLGKSIIQVGSKATHTEALRRMVTIKANSSETKREDSDEEPPDNSPKRMAVGKSLFQKELDTEGEEENQKKKLNQQIEKVALPIDEFLEFLKDFRSVVNNHKLNLFTAMSDSNLARKISANGRPH